MFSMGSDILDASDEKLHKDLDKLKEQVKRIS
jgi:hypothetical protein